MFGIYLFVSEGEGVTNQKHKKGAKIWTQRLTLHHTLRIQQTTQHAFQRRTTRQEPPQRFKIKNRRFGRASRLMTTDVVQRAQEPALARSPKEMHCIQNAQFSIHHTRKSSVTTPRTVNPEQERQQETKCENGSGNTRRPRHCRTLKLRQYLFCLRSSMTQHARCNGNALCASALRERFARACLLCCSVNAMSVPAELRGFKTEQRC